MPVSPQMCKVHPCNSCELFCWRLQKFYCLSNIINLVFGIVGHARKWGFRRKSCGNVVATSPLPGGGEDADKIPAMAQTVPAEDFARTNSQNVTDTLQQQIPGAVAIDVNGNDFAQDLRYRGFVASPIQGTPQGLAVYQNGIRVNEAFGDTVNWDLISPQAIYRADIFTNNPVFGLTRRRGQPADEEWVPLAGAYHPSHGRFLRPPQRPVRIWQAN